MQLSSIDIFPEKKLHFIRLLYAPLSWLKEREISRRWAEAFLLFMLAISAKEIAWMLISSSGVSKPISSLIIHILIGSLLNFILLLTWVALIDFSAQILGFTGNARELLLTFIYLETLYLLLLPFSLIILGSSESGTFFYGLGNLLIFIWLIKLQLSGIQEIYKPTGNGRYKIYFLPGVFLSFLFIILPIGLFLSLLLEFL
jgi:hypothetical protein